ncbi:cytochrome b/b6 domain-containing protein [Sulfurospirillum oryzae]|uniref:cytochrome b/b6 domain-containing protein n=1 Tax=Sulfurospirillum oryzae TaxID=2976535 RepID=UPI0021E822C0|nr:cytochrome b/b6 domain-containing protein [Sulfurospirillum oryzae]
MNKRPYEVFVWPLCTRIIHWIIATSFFFSFVTSFHHSLFRWHLAFGLIFGIVLLFRLIWGFIGPNYATFKTFKLSLNALQHYFIEKMTNRWRKIYAGHNAASSWFTLIVLGLGSLIVLSGLILQGIQEASGLLSGLNEHYYRLSPAVFIFHALLSYLLFFWASIHIVGVLIEQFYHKTNMVFAMLTGYKKAEGKDTTISLVRHLFSYAVIVLSLGVLYFVASSNETFFTKSRFEKRDYKSENSAFFEKCGKCHKNYPPFMLPSNSWVRLMDGLDNHFGEKITENNITKSEQNSIKEYLLAHSAETSTHKIAFKTLESLGDMRPISMSKVPYWREAHQTIEKSTFKSLHVKDASNCFACHEDFEYGIFDIARIHIPR